MENMQTKKQPFTSPDIAEKYLQLKDYAAHDMIEDIAYVYPKGKKPVFVVNANKHNHGNNNMALMALALLFVLFFPLSAFVGNGPAFAFVLIAIMGYCALSLFREKHRNFEVEPHHPEMAVFDSGIWFYRYDTYIPFERFFRLWVVKTFTLTGFARQIMFEIYLKDKDSKAVAERFQMLGYEQFYIEKVRHHKTKLNDVLSIRLPYRDGGMDITHDDIVQKISTLVAYNAHQNMLPMDSGIEIQANNP